MAVAPSTPRATTLEHDVLAPLPAGAGRFRDLLYEKRVGVARITITRPKVYNAYATATLR